MRCSSLRLLQWGHTVATGTVVPPRRRRQFVMKVSQTSHQHGAAASNMSFRPAGGSGGGLTRELSQREQYRLHQKEEEAEMCGRGIAGELMSPVPKRYGLYDGIDEHCYDAAQVSKEDRRKMMQAALERSAASVVEFTEGGEDDIDLGGMSASEYHGQADCMTVPRESALYSSVLAREELDSRKRSNTWKMARQRQQQQQSRGQDSMGSTHNTNTTTTTNPSLLKEERTAVLDDKRRYRKQDEGSYTTVFDDNLLEPNYESIGQPRSTYGMRKMFVAGLTGYQSVITREEEARICDELLHLLQDKRAAYIAEETRYCVNLYEKELGIPGKDTLAFALNSAPSLQHVLERFFHLGLIPVLPNICQVSEMIGNFAGYPIHKKPPTIGPYVGVLNLVSTTVMHLQHLDSPWFPRLHMSPRSLFVMEQPCLGDYKMGYKWTHQPFHTFEYGTRVSKDYRIEVMFAAVEVKQMRYIKDAVGLTEYAEKKKREEEECSAGKQTFLPPPLSSSSTEKTEKEEVETFVGSADMWLERLSRKLHGSEKGAMIDGKALREQLLASGGIGAKPRTLETSSVSASNTGEGKSNEAVVEKNGPTQRRMAALKARYAFAKQLKQSRPQVSSEGVHVMEGHSPHRKSSP